MCVCVCVVCVCVCACDTRAHMRVFLFQTFFLSYTREFRRVVVNIREKCRAGESEESEDWSNFQHSLRIIQTCGKGERVTGFKQPVICAGLPQDNQTWS